MTLSLERWNLLHDVLRANAESLLKYVPVYTTRTEVEQEKIKTRGLLVRKSVITGKLQYPYFEFESGESPKLHFEKGSAEAYGVIETRFFPKERREELLIGCAGLWEDWILSHIDNPRDPRPIFPVGEPIRFRVLDDTYDAVIDVLRQRYPVSVR